MIELELYARHIHRGARGRIDAWTNHDEAVVLFSDGARANATLFDDVLHVFSYRTAAGRLVDATSWRIRPTRLGFRVEGRVVPA